MIVGRKEDIDIWRFSPATGINNWGDPTWEYSHTIRGTIQPFEGSEGTRNSQRFSSVRHLIVCDSDEDVTDADQLVFRNEYNKIVYIQDWTSGVISHLEIYTTNVQEDKTAE
jgi:hypothetical protein